MLVRAVSILVLTGSSFATALAQDNAGPRNSKKISAGVLYTPLSDFVLQYGVGGTFMLNQDMQLGFNVLTGSDSLPELPEEDLVEVTQADLSGMAVYGHMRYFFGDTFYVLGGLGYRSATFDYKIEDKTSNDYLKGDLEISSVIAPIAIGNQWNWDGGLIVGVDWLTYMLALSGSSEGSTETTFGGATGADVEALNDDMVEVGDQLSKTSTLTLALVYIAYGF